jgi:hypothetical protein
MSTNTLFEKPERKPRGRAVLVLVLALVNLAAIWGQAGSFLEHVVPAALPPNTHWAFGLALALAFAAALELTGVYLALSADDADDVGVPSGGMRFGSYVIGLTAGALSFSFWGWNHTGLAFGILSTMSPFLWAVRAKIRRGQPVAPSRRFWHPKRSVTLIREMAWRGLANEEAALRQLNAEATPATPTAPAPVPAPATEVEVAEPTPLKVKATIERPAGDTVLRAIHALQSGQTPAEAAAVSGLSASMTRKYAAVVRALRQDPNAELKTDVRASAVSQIREWAKRENAQWP